MKSCASLVILPAAPHVVRADGARTAGEVQKIGKAAATLTIEQRASASSGRLPTTMVFAPRDKVLVERVKPGDMVEFSAATESGKFCLTDSQVQR